MIFISIVFRKIPIGVSDMYTDQEMQFMTISYDMHKLNSIERTEDTKEFCDSLFEEIRDTAQKIITDDSGEINITKSILDEFKNIDCPISIYKVPGGKYEISISYNNIGVVIDTADAKTIFMK